MISMSITLEEALGLKPETTDNPQQSEDEQEYSDFDLKRLVRRKMVFERRAKGDTVEEIVSFCHKNGFPVTQRTIYRDLKSSEVESFTDELMRLQLRDIALLRGYALADSSSPDLKALASAIYARANLLRNLVPRTDNPVNVEVNVQQKMMVAFRDNLERIIKFSRD